MHRSREEPELRKDIEQLVAAESAISVSKQLEERWSTGKSGFAIASMSIPQFVAANELGIELPIILHAAIATSMDPGYRELGNETYLAVLRAKPKEASDALLLHLPFVAGGGMAVMQGSNRIKRLFVENESFWFEAMPIVSEHTTRPDIWNWILKGATDSSSMGGGGMGGMGGGSFEDPFKLSEAMRNRIEASIQRTQERTEAESIPQTQPTIPEHLQGGGMF